MDRPYLNIFSGEDDSMVEGTGSLGKSVLNTIARQAQQNFKLADTDGSGQIDAKELTDILQAQGWNTTAQVAQKIIEQIGTTSKDSGALFVLDEEQFLNVMVSGKLNSMLKDWDVSKKRSQ